MPEAEITNSDALLDALSALRDDFKAHGNITLSWKCEGVRTDRQRKAIEVFCRLLADALNDAGQDQVKVLAAMKEGTEIPWSQPAVKDSIWRQIQIALLDKESTSNLEPKEVSRVYDVVNRFTSERFGISVRFPDRFGS